ncbi:hypothetical protein NpPPO83_00003268 [Neofusicoccum parvum]|uniref:Uncharacterized protein n=1 Tax=Neofusicoccum parvum TaxID=310453 RepID=A0ACB5S009_9PEZI|nr:hypothetical protein NpPPO83_00003268 [Neofusicoccum parvum]
MRPLLLFAACALAGPLNHRPPPAGAPVPRGLLNDDCETVFTTVNICHNATGTPSLNYTTPVETPSTTLASTATETIPSTTSSAPPGYTTSDVYSSASSYPTSTCTTSLTSRPSISSTGHDSSRPQTSNSSFELFHPNHAILKHPHNANIVEALVEQLIKIHTDFEHHNSLLQFKFQDYHFELFGSIFQLDCPTDNTSHAHLSSHFIIEIHYTFNTE